MNLRGDEKQGLYARKIHENLGKVEKINFKKLFNRIFIFFYNFHEVLENSFNHTGPAEKMFNFFIANFDQLT